MPEDLSATIKSDPKTSLHPWICCQLGAREHYALPRALHQSRLLHSLFTDIWFKSDNFLSQLPNGTIQSLGERSHCDLDSAQVSHATLQAILFELQQKAQTTQGWNLILKRNQWFQHQAISYLQRLNFQGLSPQPILFSYSYVALSLFKYAKSQGWRTVLGQFNPGILEQKILDQECDHHSHLVLDNFPPPAIYWKQWLEECNLADIVLVNSSWSRQLIQQAGVPSNKIKVIPLVYTPPINALTFERNYPNTFSGDRPLRVLFLGQISLRKGIAEILGAISLLSDLPIEFLFVGTPQIAIPEDYKKSPKIIWVGKIPRSQTAYYYQSSDVFLFPTLSDGFGLTQLEAQAWRLPIIASQYCGDVVKHDINGLILPCVTPEHIANAIRSCIKSPTKLKKFSQSCQKLSDQFTLGNLSDNLVNLNFT